MASRSISNSMKRPPMTRSANTLVVPGTLRTTASTSVPMRSSVARSAPAILMPTGVLMPVESMSMRVRMGIVHALFRPGICTTLFSASVSSSGVRLRCAMTLPSSSLMSTAGHSDSGLRRIVVSIMSIGAGSVAVSARPALPKTSATSGNDLISRSVTCRISRAFVGEMPGNVVGI